MVLSTPLPDLLGVRLAHALRPLWGPREGEYHDVHEEPRDVALIELRPGESAALAAQLPRADARLLGSYLLVERARRRDDITAAGLDEVHARATELARWAAGAATA